MTTGARRDRVIGSLKDPTHADDRDHVDIIIALGVMAKEGFHWIWCEHALTVGYRSSLTEIVQIIGRANARCTRQDQRPVHEPDRGTGRDRRRR